MLFYHFIFLRWHLFSLKKILLKELVINLKKINFKTSILLILNSFKLLKILKFSIENYYFKKKTIWKVNKSLLLKDFQAYQSKSLFHHWDFDLMHHLTQILKVAIIFHLLYLKSLRNGYSARNFWDLWK